MGSRRRGLRDRSAVNYAKLAGEDAHDNEEPNDIEGDPSKDQPAPRVGRKSRGHGRSRPRRASGSEPREGASAPKGRSSKRKKEINDDEEEEAEEEEEWGGAELALQVTIEHAFNSPAVWDALTDRAVQALASTSTLLRSGRGNGSALDMQRIRCSEWKAGQNRTSLLRELAEIRRDPSHLLPHLGNHLEARARGFRSQTEFMREFRVTAREMHLLPRQTEALRFRGANGSFDAVQYWYPRRALEALVLAKHGNFSSGRVRHRRREGEEGWTPARAKEGGGEERTRAARPEKKKRKRAPKKPALLTRVK